MPRDTNPAFSFIFRIKTALPCGQSQQAKRYLRPPGSHSKELAKTISLKSPAILIWQPDSITRRKNCFSRHQHSLGNYLNCVMIMPQSSGESFMLRLSNTQERFTSAEECASISSQEERGWGGGIKSPPLCSISSGSSQLHTHVTHKRERNSKIPEIERANRGKKN